MVGAVGTQRCRAQLTDWAAVDHRAMPSKSGCSAWPSGPNRFVGLARTALLGYWAPGVMRFALPVRFSAVTLLVAFGLGAVGCDGKDQKSQPPTPKSQVPTASATSGEAIAPDAPPADHLNRPLNVLMLSVDCLRADMPWAGYSRPIAPRLTELAQKSVVYTQAYAASSYTAQSVAAILSGRFASTLYRTGVFFTAYPQSNLFFPESLKEKGVRSIGWFSHLYFGRGKGLDQGFDTWEIVPGIKFDPQTDNNVTSDKMLELGKKLLGNPANTQGRFFAWAHFGDPHDVYIKHPEAPDFGRKNRDRYDSEVWYTDFHLGKLLDFAAEQPFWKDTAVIITGDHGEAFGEHGQYRHAFDLWENLVRVPLIVYLPGVTPRRIDVRRSHIDLAPTILELLGEKPLEQFMGTSLVKEIRGAAPAEPREPIVLELTEDTNNPQRRAIIAKDKKLIVRGYDVSFSLYDLAKDPGETTDLAKTDPALLDEMKTLYRATFAKIPSIRPYGGMKLDSGREANGPFRPAKTD